MSDEAMKASRRREENTWWAEVTLIEQELHSRYSSKS